MKSFLAIVRIALMAGMAGLLLAGVETTSSAATADWQAAAHGTSGAALLLGAYGFLIMLRRRMRR